MQKWSVGNVNGIRLPTASEEVLGIFLKDPKTFTTAGLTPAMFGEYAWLYKIMRETAADGEMTFRSVAIRCPEQIELLHGLRNSVATVSTLPTLLTELRKRHLAEQLRRIGRELYERAGEEDPDEVLRHLQERVYAMNSSEVEGAVDPGRDVDEWFEWLNTIMDDPSQAFGLMTGLEIDRITTGFHRQDLIVIGARTSMGKSAFVLELLIRLMRNGYKCALFSLEMSKRQVYLRMMANLMGVSLEVLKTGRLAKERRHEIEQHREFLKRLYVDDSRAVTADYIAESMRKLKRTNGLDFVVVDYIQDVVEPGEINDNSGSAIARICRKLRKAAQECDCAMVGLSQVKREVEVRQDKRPTISDLAGSTGIETSADAILLLYRDEYYFPDTTKRGILEVNIAKQRNGAVGMVELYYDKEYQRITNIAK